MTKRPILITGSHRSGSTWVGKTISAAQGVSYIHEPFSFTCRPGICNADVPYWFTHITDRNSSLYYKPIHDTLTFKYNLLAELKACQKPKDYARAVRDLTITIGARLSRSQPLIKDPLAFFSAEWLADSFGMDVVVLIRHPAAFVSSLKVKGWSFPFDHFLRQEELMQTHLYPFSASIESYVSSQQDIIDQGILLWNIIHQTILNYQNHRPEWLFIRHEDISRNPTEKFQEIFQYLNLEFSSSVRETIVRSTGTNNQKETTDDIHNVKRNSELNIWNWKERLTSSEINRIQEGVEVISEAFYTVEDWEGDKSNLSALIS